VSARLVEPISNELIMLGLTRQPRPNYLLVVELLGRAAELQTLDAVLASAREGRGEAVVVRGDAGMGKTALLDHAVRSAAEGFRLTRVEGVESETELAYAGLHRLLVPLLAGLDDLADPQRRALQSAFGLAAAGAPDRFLVGLATLSLICDGARQGPLLCVIDDAQWLDRESLEAMAIAARRLDADPVAMLFAGRDTSSIDVPLEGLREIRVRGLDPQDAAELVRSVLSATLDDSIVDRIVVETGGTPLAIIELSHELSADELAWRGLPPGPLPLGRRLEQHYLRQVDDLPEATRLFLLVAAAEPSEDHAVIVEAAISLGVDAAAADPATDRRLLDHQDRPRFRHPLIRSAVYGGAPASERRRVHAALAAATDGQRDGDRRAWHRAAATSGVDDTVAVELEAAAARARARGGYSAAGMFLARAAELTSDPDRRADRVLAAANSHLIGGAPARARALLDAAKLEFSDPLQKAAAMRLEGAIDFARGHVRAAVPQLIASARALAPYDIGEARKTLLHAAAAASFAGPYAPPNGRNQDIARMAGQLVLPHGHEPTAPHLLLDGYALLHSQSPAAALPVLQRALAALVAADATSEEALLWLGIGCWVAGAIGDDGALDRLATRLVEAARDQGALIQLANGLLYLSMYSLLNGSVERARSIFAERSALLGAVGITGDVGPMIIAAWAGDEAQARVEMEAVTRYTVEHQQGWMFAFVDYARQILELGLGHYDAARPDGASEYHDDSFLSVVSFPNAIEALVRSGRADEAAAALQVFAERALRIDTPISLGLLARSRALLAGDDGAESLFEEAIELLSRSRAEINLSRAHLLYGEWLRRQLRRTDARAHLRLAYERFVEQGVGAFAERARIELEATGERARRRVVETANDLTPQETEIARLVADGLTNAEIGTKLFVSAHTVDYHLRKVFRKVDVNSRRQLARALVGGGNASRRS
jgi:DNA-binding CsgD family transcriptional regulator